MKLRMTASLIGVSALVLVGVAVPAQASDGQKSIGEIVPALARSQVSADRVPATVDLGSLGGIPESAVRSLGSDGLADYWVARVGSSEICLILHIPGGDEISASTCKSAEQFYREGIGLRAGVSPDDERGSAEAYLLPADVAVVDVIGGGQRQAEAWGASDANLITVLPGDQKLRSAQLDRANGITFRFTPLSFKGKGD